MTTVIGSGRMAFMGQTTEPVFSSLELHIPAGEFLGDGVYAPAFMVLAEPPVGLFEAIGPSGYDRPYSAIRALGASPGASFRVWLSPNGVWIGPDEGGWTVSMGFTITRNGVLFYEETVVSPVAPSWVLSWLPSLTFTTVLAVATGDVFRCGLTPSRMPGIYAYSGGTGQGQGMRISGELTPPGDEPSISLHGSGAVPG